MDDERGQPHSGRTLFVSDLDGTLLRPDTTLSTETVHIINDFIDRGGLFTYATARSFTSASRVTAPLRLRLPVVTYGGAIVVNPRTGQPRPARMLAVDVVAETLRLTSDSDQIQPVVFAIHEGRDRVCWLADHVTPGVASFLAHRQDDPRLFPLRDWTAIDVSSVFYLALIGAGEPLHDLYRRLTEVRAHCHAVLAEDIYTPGEWWLEITAPAATKAAAIAALKRELAADTLVCFGDNHNDLPMFAVADAALAVANAVPELRAAASSVIGANTADGVARWISDHARLPSLVTVSRCRECQHDFGEDPVRLAERCAAFSTDMSRVLQATELDVLLLRPDPQTWSPLEYAAHLSEAIPWYVARIHKVLQEDAAQLEPFDWDLAANEGNYRQRSVETVTRELQHACAALAALARSVTGEDLARTGTGSDGTPRTVRVLLGRAGHELTHHELDIRRGVSWGSAR